MKAKKVGRPTGSMGLDKVAFGLIRQHKEALKEIARKEGRTLADVCREFIRKGLAA